MNGDSILFEIWSSSHYMGNILYHLQKVREDEDQGSYFLIPMLAMLVEKAIKMYFADVENDDGVYEKSIGKLIRKAFDQKIINDSELDVLEELRDFRNRYFHGLEYNDGIVVDGKFSAFSEAETHQAIYDLLGPSAFAIILKFSRL